LASKIDKVYDQLEINSCTANALCQLYKVLDPDDTFEPSRLFLYYKERQLGKNVDEDTGANVIDGMRYMVAHGVCSEKLWPYVISNVLVKPPTYCIDDAKNHKISTPMMIDGTGDTLLKNIKSTLYSGRPVMCGVMIYESFMSSTVAQTGIVSMPKSKNLNDPHDSVDPLLGGHELLIVGYDDKNNRFLLVNSWGTQWGCSTPDTKTRGYLWLPYSYVVNPDLVQDCCTFDRVVSNFKSSAPITTKNMYITNMCYGSLCGRQMFSSIH
jgi:C1A family cysteine protease